MCSWRQFHVPWLNSYLPACLLLWVPFLILFHFAYPSAGRPWGNCWRGSGLFSFQDSRPPLLARGTACPPSLSPGGLAPFLTLSPSCSSFLKLLRTFNILTHPLTQVESISVPTYCSRVGWGSQLSPLFVCGSVVYMCLCAYVCMCMNVCLCMPRHACVCTCLYMCVSEHSSPRQLGRRILLPLSHPECHPRVPQEQTCILQGPW